MDVSDVVRVVVYGVPASISQYYQVETHIKLMLRLAGLVALLFFMFAFLADWSCWSSWATIYLSAVL